MSADVSCPVKSVANLCQVLAGLALDWYEPPSVESVADLFISIESPSLEVGRLSVERTLRLFLQRMAETVHANFHARFRTPSSCGFTARSLISNREADDTILVHTSIATWMQEFRDDYFAAHNSAAQRARRLLDSVTGAGITIEAVSKSVAMGRRTLERHFRSEVGVTIADYRTRLRLTIAVRELHDEQSGVESAARTAGWSSKKGLYDALCDHGGFKPLDIRKMSRTQMEHLIESFAIVGNA